MRRIIVALLVVGLMAGSAVAAEEKPNPDILQKAAEKLPETPETPAEGTLFRALGGEWLTKRTGVVMDNTLQVGFSRNSVSDTAARSGGGSNAPIGYPYDENFQFNSIELFIHRDMKSNIIPRITPIPGPVPKKFDWGFMAETVYGRNGQPCVMYGYDQHWGPNEPGASNAPEAASTRQNFLCTPNVYAQAYFPFFKGIAMTVGRFGSGIGYEIPPVVRPSPDYFYSRTYAFYAQPDQVFGYLLSANVMRSPKNGYLAVEFGMNNGWQVLDSPNDGFLNNFMGAIRWRSPHMSTWIDYTFITGPGEVKMPAGGFSNPASAYEYFPRYHVVSTSSQNLFYNSLHGQHDFNAHWKVTAEFLYGKQSGDGKSDTYLIGGPAPAPPSFIPNFKGALWNGFNGQGIYTYRKGLSMGFRFERFHNPQGFALYPLTVTPVNFGGAIGVLPMMNAAAGNLNDATLGIHYDLTKYMMLRPEIRYDWQTKNNGRVFGASNTTQSMASSQITGSIDLVLYF